MSKRRLDAYGNVIETRQDGIGHTKVRSLFKDWERFRFFF